ncbi:MAG TPA: ATPase, T2SS/T4P/T4SS family, partial [Rubrivivax sp.]|nr:ATPase, T2SS/T4P/T4SS family [Rubrivivax sp.]
PLSSALAAPADDPLAERPTLPYRLTLHDGETLDGRTLGPQERACGVFLFEPVDPLGRLRRHFVPREAYAQLEVGARMGELLVQQQAATREAVEQVAQEQAALRAQKIGDVMLGRQVITPVKLEQAIEQQSQMPMVRIGEALLALGFVTPAQLDEALAQQCEDRSVPLGELLVRKGVVSRDDLQQALARKMGYPIVDVTRFPAEPEALTRVPHALATRLVALPLMLRAGRLVVALVDPSRRKALEELEFVAQCAVVPVLASPDALPGAIDRAYDRLGIGAWLPADGLQFDLAREREPHDANQLLATLELNSADQRRSEDEPQIEQSDNSLVRLINQMILEAQAQGVSDIHVECQPGREKVRIRFRKDGQLRPYLELPHTYRAAIIARLKIMCDLDISERRKPQDGKINFGRFQPGARLELRLATIPTNGNLEDAVLRLLASARPLPLDGIGLSPANLAGLKSVMERPYGMLLCVGPTGSGKTTTLHSALGYINKPDRKIWTAE